MPRNLQFGIVPTLLPIGHERDSVRRAPVVTIGLIVCCVLVHLVTQIAFAPSMEERAALNEAFDAMMAFWEAHPQLEPPGWNDWLLDRLPATEAWQLAAFEPLPLAQGKDPDITAQDELEELAVSVVEAVPETASDRWGFSTLGPSLFTAFTYMFLHADWWHVLGNLLLLWVCGALLEDVWGRGVFLGLYLLAGLICLLPDLLRDESILTVGASGAISGVMGAFAVRFWNVRMRILVMAGILTGVVWVPSWVILLFWFAKDLVGVGAELAGTTNIAHTAHLAGFALGAAVALTFRRARVEQRWLAAAVEAKSARLVHRNEPVEKAFDEFDRELHPVGLKRLALTVRRDPENADAAIALWDQALEEGNHATARGAMVQAIEAELRAGDVESATDHWRELAVHFPGAILEPRSLFQIGRCLERRGFRSEAGEAMARALAATDAQTPTAFLLRIAEATRQLEPRVSTAAATAVLARAGRGSQEHAQAARLAAEADARLVRVPSR